MGTDINMYAEVRNQGRWSLAEPNKVRLAKLTDQGPISAPNSIFDDRIYSLFAILGDVRNPIRSVTKFETVSKPRGLPSDVSPEILSWHAAYKEWAYSESWLLLRELEAFDWYGKEILRRGIVNPAVAHLFSPGCRGFPRADWPKGVTIAVGDTGFGVDVQWTETYAEAVGGKFLDETMAMLRRFGSRDDVRIVFWVLRVERNLQRL